MLHPLEVLGVADQALVHPVAVPGAAGLDLLDVGVDLLLLGGEVVDQDPGVADLVVELDPRSGRSSAISASSGRVSPLVAQLVGTGVEVLDVEQGFSWANGSAFSVGSSAYGFTGGTARGR